ncbi:glycosyltransferase [Clostridium vitabionis]|uniref:glycosyltransferase n=1 Tax=Clostridium vitabionis TaxID=2784388 RepID=UPI00188C18A8|nr:glycosyltransferase [Clostridium vitabionis]
MRKKRVLHLLKSEIYSGAENVVCEIIRNLSDQYDFLYVASEGPIRKVLTREHIPFILLRPYNLMTLRMVIDRFHPDVIHAHDFTASVYAALAAGRTVPVISQLHYDPPWVYHKNVKTLTYSVALKNIQRLYLVTPVHMKKLAFYPVCRDKIRVIGNPVSTEEIRERAAEQEGGEPSDVLFIGRLEEQKDPLRFIRIIDHLKRSGQFHIQAIMLGDGNLKRECALEIHKRGLSGNIAMKGFVNNPLAYLKKTKVLCMTSKFEGFGLVCIEAASLSIPVVTTKTSGTLNIYHAADQILFDQDEEIENRITELLQNKDEWSRASRQSQEISEKMENYHKYFRRIDRGYQELTAR